MERYLSAWRARHGRGSVSVITARGCPYHCRWCSHSTYGKTHRRRSPAGVAEEVAWIAERYQPEMLWMADDVFTIHPGWIVSYVSEMRRRGLRIPFECITRADRMSERMAEALASLGCFRVWIGSESGSQRILDAMERGVRVEQVRTAVRLLREHGIETGMFLMWGYEGEDLSDIEATVEHVKECRPDVFLTTVSYPIKGTPYHDEVNGRLVRIGDWAATTDRDIRIRGRHSRRFYQFADQLLKSEAAGRAAEADAARRGLQEAFAEVEA
jgi:anaerobic magnesium-protoporphyrin IX monomethyl ester cyclase